MNDFGTRQINSDQVTIGGTSAALAIARPTRHRLMIRNTHGSQVLYINMAAAATTSHFQIPAGASMVVTGVGLWNAISDGAGTVVHIVDEYD